MMSKPFFNWILNECPEGIRWHFPFKPLVSISHLRITPVDVCKVHFNFLISWPQNKTEPKKKKNTSFKSITY